MRREELYLRDIIEAVDAVKQFLEGIEKNDFIKNDLLRSAVLQKFGILGEASARLSPELKSRYPQTSWKRIIGLRNIAAHAYFTIDFEIVWLTVANRLEPLRKEVIAILQIEYPDFELPDKD